MRTIILLFWTIAVCNFAFLAQVNRDPAKAQFVTTDIDNFWRAFDLANKESERAAKVKIFEREYIDKASDGLKGFISHRVQSAENLVAVIEKHPKYYAAIRPDTLRLAEFEKQSRRSFANLKNIYPDAVFPNVYFVVGALNSGGTTSPNAIIIGAEMNALADDAPRDELNSWLKANLKMVDGVPPLIAHELIHIQQKYGDVNTLLGKAIGEGSADFLGEKISGKQPNDVQHVYGAAHEKDLWNEFQKEMNGTDISNWMYNGDKSKTRPADLGYYIGYKICESFYERAKDKKQAVREILETKDFTKFLQESGYAAKFNKTK